MPTLGAPELILILVIVLLLFGIGRIGKIGGELGKGIKSFRDGLKGDDDKPTEGKVEEKTEEEIPKEK
jgi:sec-independent protein translocase protein TatA